MNKILKDYTFFEDNTKNIILELLVEQGGLMLNEAIKVSKTFEQILNIYGYKLPEEDKIKEIRLTNTPGTLDIVKIDNLGRERVTSVKGIGKVLKMIFPNIDVVKDHNVQKLISELNILTMDSDAAFDFEIQIRDDIEQGYIDAYNDGVGSCVTDNGRIEQGITKKILTGIDKESNIQLVLMKNRAAPGKSNKIIGRALLWHNVVGLDAPYLDRTYPSKSEEVHAKFISWARHKGYYYRNGMGPNDYTKISEKDRIVEFHFNKHPNEVKVFPYMDTFLHGYDIDDKLIISNNLPDNARHIKELRHSNGASVMLRYNDGYNEKWRISLFEKHLCGSCGTPISPDTATKLYYGFYVCEKCFNLKYASCDDCHENFSGNDIRKINENSDKLKVKKVCVYSKYQEDICCIQKYRRCDDCNSYIKRDEVFQVNNRNVCKSCLDTKYFKCKSCGYYKSIDDSKTVESDDGYGGSKICNRCVHNYYDTCVSCNKIKYKDYMYNGRDGRRVCKKCYNDLKYITCYNCGYVSPGDKAIKINNGDVFVCEFCSKYVIKCKICNTDDLADRMTRYKSNSNEFVCSKCTHDFNMARCIKCRTLIKSEDFKKPLRNDFGKWLGIKFGYNSHDIICKDCYNADKIQYKKETGIEGGNE